MVWLRPEASRIRIRGIGITVLALLLTPLLLAAQPERPSFSVERGFYDAPFHIIVGANDPGAIIYYTVDGSTPTPSEGFPFEDDLYISKTIVVKAVAALPDGQVSDVETHTYIFVDDVVRQPKEIDGWKADRYWAGGNAYVDHDYEMDPEIVDHPSYSDEIRAGLLAIPTISLSMDRDLFWQVYDGDAEEVVTVEVLYPDDPEASHASVGGLVAHSHNRLKRSLRLTFRSEYGDGKFDTDLFRRALFHGDSATDEFDRIVLRGGNNRCWARIWNDGKAAYTRDQWYRDTQLSMSGVGARGVFVHLYINGLYWGLYNPTERPDSWFASAYFGGDREEWFSISHGGTHGGDPVRWNTLTGDIMRRDLSNPSDYALIREYIDVAQFADYVMLTWFTRMTDWPRNNWWAAVRNVPPGKTQFFGWDNEWSWYKTGSYSSGGAWVHPDFRSGTSSTSAHAGGLWHALRKNPDFMMMFADRVYKHSFNGGALSDDTSRLRWQQLNDHVRASIVAESARWGDAMEERGHSTRTRDADWQNEVDAVDALMNGNVERFISALKREGYYPSLLPAVFSIPGGEVAGATTLSISNPNPFGTGEILYTTDGTDPRLPGGDVSPHAFRARTNASVQVDRTTLVRVRILDETTWSPLHEALYIIEAGYVPLKVTELMYHPDQCMQRDPDDCEFIELQNTGNTTIDLYGASFSDGIGFAFSDPTSIEPGAFLVLASDSAGFRQRYGFGPFGQYTGRLSNRGESLALEHAFGDVIWEMEYKDRTPWPEGADGDGYSLVLVQPDQQRPPNLPSSWRTSSSVGGSPGAHDAASTSVMTPQTNCRHAVGSPYPNPVHDRVTIPVEVCRPTSIHVALYDLLGRSVEYMHDVRVHPGSHGVEVNLPPVSPGIYLMHLGDGDTLQGRRLIVVLNR